MSAGKHGQTNYVSGLLSRIAHTIDTTGSLSISDRNAAHQSLIARDSICLRAANHFTCPTKRAGDATAIFKMELVNRYEFKEPTEL